MAAVAQWSFNQLFWNEKLGCLYDVINGGPPDPSIRPNQIFAVSLPHSMLRQDRARSVVEKVEEHLLTLSDFGVSHQATRTIADETPAPPRNVMEPTTRELFGRGCWAVHYRLYKGE